MQYSFRYIPSLLPTFIDQGPGEIYENVRRMYKNHLPKGYFSKDVAQHIDLITYFYCKKFDSYLFKAVGELLMQKF